MTKCSFYSGALTFSGRDAEECCNFIQAVKKSAFSQGKQRDQEWMVDFASIHFTGDALEWLIDLDPDVSGNWPLLQRALAETYLSTSAERGMSPDISSEDDMR